MEVPGRDCLIQLDSSNKTADYLAYMARISAWIGQGYRPAKELSPHEDIDSTVGVTFLNSPEISASSVDEYNKWAQHREDISVDVYGTFAVTVDNPGDRNWDSAFRFLFDGDYPRLGTAFVMVRMLTTLRRQKPKAAATVTLFSGSQIWLRDSISLNGRVGNAAAEANLAKLVGVASLFISPQSQPHETALSVDGKTFNRGLDRLERAFAHLVI